jgi:hypothetical protein
MGEQVIGKQVIESLMKNFPRGGDLRHKNSSRYNNALADTAW